jgi:hypothetical protein
MGVTCSTQEMRNTYKFWLENLMGGDQLEDLSTDVS